MCPSYMIDPECPFRSVTLNRSFFLWNIWEKNKGRGWVGAEAGEISEIGRSPSRASSRQLTILAENGGAGREVQVSGPTQPPPLFARLHADQGIHLLGAAGQPLLVRGPEHTDGGVS